MSRSKPIVVVTCDSPNGCNSRLEVDVTLASKKLEFGYDKNEVTRAIQSQGWQVAPWGGDLCEQCASFERETVFPS